MAFGAYPNHAAKTSKKMNRMDEARQATAELEAFRSGYPFLPRLRELLKEMS